MNKTLQSSNTPRQKLLNRLEQNEARMKKSQAEKFNVPPAGVRKSPVSGMPPGQTPKPSNRPGSLAARADKVMKRNPTWNRANVEARIAKRKALKLKSSAGTGAPKLMSATPRDGLQRVGGNGTKPKVTQKRKALGQKKLQNKTTQLAQQMSASKPPTIKTKARVKKPKK